MRACLRAIAPHQAEWAEAFASGLRRHGWQATVRKEPEPCDLLVMWGTRQQAMIDRQRSAGGEVCILERGYLGDRFRWTSVSFGGQLNGRAEFRGVRDDAGRFDAHFGELVMPWTARDGYALLIGQVAGDMSLKPVGGDLAAWYRDTAMALVKKGYDVRYRPHPGTVKRGGPVATPPGAKPIGGTLADALSSAALVVTFNSNTGVESVLAGVPTVAMDRGSMAWPVTTHFLDAEPVRPARSSWLAQLAWMQWTLDEMASGECWAHVGKVHASV